MLGNVAMVGRITLYFPCVAALVFACSSNIRAGPVDPTPIAGGLVPAAECKVAPRSLASVRQLSR